MYIYLDTSHLQKWQRNNGLKPDDVTRLNQLKNSSNNNFVISVLHIFDITDASDERKSIDMGKFLDNLQIKWARNCEDLEYAELKRGIAFYNSMSEDELTPFVANFVDTLHPNCEGNLSIRLHGRGKSIETIISEIYKIPLKQRKSSLIVNMQTWSKGQSDIISQEKTPEAKAKKIKDNLCNVLRKDIDNLKLAEVVVSAVTKHETGIFSPVDKFVDWLVNKHPDLIPSTLIRYYIQHYMHRNAGQKWEKSHFDDLGHIAMLPYVDFISVDKEMFRYTKEAIKYLIENFQFPDSWQQRIITDITDITPK